MKDHRIQRPPHFGEGPEQRTKIDPPPDYPSVTEMEDYPEAPEPEEPLQVAVAELPDAVPEIRDWNAYQLFVDDNRMVKLAGRNENRRRLLISNHDNTVAVFIGRNRADSTQAMYELHAGTNGVERPSLELFHQGEVWAICGTNDSTTVSVLSEFIPHER